MKARAHAPIAAFRSNPGTPSRLAIGPVGDRFERQAEATADRVAAGLALARPLSLIPGPLVPVHPPAPVQEGEAESQERETAEPAGEIQRQAEGAAPAPAAPPGGLPNAPPGPPSGHGASPVTPGVAAGIWRAQGGGEALAPAIRRPLEGAFQWDFAHVRVHADAEADRLSRAVSARAFTLGSDVFFRQGAYQPESHAGRRLLAHELTHVVQQGAGAPAVIQRVAEACFIPGNRDAPYAGTVNDGAARMGPNMNFEDTRHDRVLAANSAHRHRTGTVQFTTANVVNYQSDNNNAVLVTKDALQFALAEVDHIVPAAVGGGNTAKNAQVLSSHENNAKADTYPWTSATHVAYNGVRVYLHEAKSGIAAGSILTTAGHGAGATVRVPAGRTLAAGSVLIAQGTPLAAGFQFPAGWTIPAGINVRQGAGRAHFLESNQVLTTAHTLTADLQDLATVAAGVTIPNGTIIPTGSLVPTGFPLGPAVVSLAPMMLPAPVTLTAAYTLMAPLYYPGAVSQDAFGQQLTAGTNLLVGAQINAGTFVPAGFPINSNLAATTALTAPAILNANTVLPGPVTTTNNLNLLANLDLSAPAARANRLMPNNFYPP